MAPSAAFSHAARCTLAPRREKPATCGLPRAAAVAAVDAAIQELQPAFARVDAATRLHLRALLSAMREERVGPHHFGGVDGYGHGDLGRHALDAVYARLFGCESALVRVQFMSGTHAIAAVLFGVLRPGDELVSIAGAVYDTLEEVIGTRETMRDSGSLRDWGVTFRELSLLEDGTVDFDGIGPFLSKKTKAVFIQRSFGYAWRKALSLADITRIIRSVRAVAPECVCFVDNCYGEFLDDVEPVHPSVGADVMAGSLIKNLGGSIAPSGAYVAGRADLVEKARRRLAAPGIGGGATLGMNRTLFQGLFLAPQMVGEASKGGLLVAEVMSKLGYETNPPRGERGFVQSVRLEREWRVMEFCKAVQRNGPVGAYIEPTKGVTSGYGDPVVFAQGTFIDGSTLELSADAPLREPYAVYAQGGLHWTHWAIVLEDIVEALGYNDRD